MYEKYDIIKKTIIVLLCSFNQLLSLMTVCRVHSSLVINMLYDITWLCWRYIRFKMALQTSTPYSSFTSIVDGVLCEWRFNYHSCSITFTLPRWAASKFRYYALYYLFSMFWSWEILNINSSFLVISFFHEFMFMNLSFGFRNFILCLYGNACCILYKCYQYFGWCKRAWSWSISSDWIINIDI